MARSSLITLATFGSVGTAAIISVVWLALSSGDGLFEPAVGLLGILGGLTGILAERQVIHANLHDELRRATTALTDATFAPPRRQHSPLSDLPAPTTLRRRRRADLRRATRPRRHRTPQPPDQWRDDVNGFHRRLELTETRVFTAAAHEAIDFHRALHRKGGYLDHIHEQLSQLQFMLDQPTHLTKRRTS